MPTVIWDHVHLRSPDPEATASWLQDILGGEIIRGPGRIDVKLGGANVFIAPVTAGDGVNTPPVTPYQGLDHFGLTVKDIDAVAAEIKAKGVEFTKEPTTIRPGVRICFIRGPQGISIELLGARQEIRVTPLSRRRGDRPRPVFARYVMLPGMKQRMRQSLITAVIGQTMVRPTRLGSVITASSGTCIHSPFDPHAILPVAGLPIDIAHRAAVGIGTTWSLPALADCRTTASAASWHSGRRDRGPRPERRPAAASTTARRRSAAFSSGPRDDGPWFHGCCSQRVGAARGRRNSSSWSPVSLAPAPAGRCRTELCISRANLIRALPRVIAMSRCSRIIKACFLSENDPGNLTR